MSRAPFESLVEAHGARVWRVCRALLDEADADDAWSETFLAALEAYPTLAHDTRIEGWLVTIAHRKAIDVLRRRSRLVLGEPPDRLAPDATVPGRARDLDLARALLQLPPRQRESVVLHHLGGLPFTEVAAALGASSDAVRRASSDGVRRLRSLMGGDDG
ncbi:RNA polymerase sigma factor [Agrococcus carbonis]|uniref:RNA polymerase sigma factor, sigma-70 family n=1 Tax=Agrococcus carbonis TaxID=684552 RepID=A0A1H1MX81_9MICO|nr:RNA polymerase sigma factor [Agrococcus carbonis]SDR91075.1 RNA polymerase sigma factor, sigma-70 family [Agrococcus carbonis]